MNYSFAIRVFTLTLFAGLAQQATAQPFSNLQGEVTGAVRTDSRWQVELRSLNESRTLPPDRAYIQPDGRFQFPNVRLGSYEVTLLDPDQRPVRSEMVTVSGVGTSLVQIRADQRGNAAAAPKGTISLRRLAHKISKPARKEYEKGWSLRRQARLDEAQVHYRRALELDPQFVEAANDLGALYYMQSRYDDSLRVLERGLAIEPESAPILANLSANMMATGRYPEAELLARRALAVDPVAVRTRYLYGLSRASQKKYDAETQSLLEDAARSIPHAHLALANLYRAKGDRGAARGALESYLAARKSQPDPQRPQIEAWLKSLR